MSAQEAHDVSHGDRDSESESAESYTDSGRGNSEEGDNCRHGDPFNTECRGRLTNNVQVSRAYHTVSSVQHCHINRGKRVTMVVLTNSNASHTDKLQCTLRV